MFVVLIRMLCLFFLSGSLLAAPAQTALQPPFWDKDPAVVTPEGIAAASDTTQKELEAIPKEATDDSGDGQRRIVLKKRLDLLKELAEVTGRVTTLTASRKQWLAEEPGLQQALREIEQKAPPVAPAAPTPEGFDSLKKSLEEVIAEESALLTDFKHRQELMGQLSARIQETSARRKNGQDQLAALEEVIAKSAADARALPQAQAGNARLDLIVAQSQEKLWAEEQAFETATLSTRDKKMALARLKKQWREQAFALYQEALNRQQADLLKKQEDLLSAKEQAVMEASTPREKYLSRREAEIARAKKNITDLNIQKTDLVSAISEQEKMLQAEREELKNLEVLIKQSGTRQVAGEILKETFKRAGQRRLALQQSLQPELLARLSSLQARSFEIDAQFFNLREIWQQELAGFAIGLPARERQSLEAASDRLLADFRQLLTEEKRLIFDILGEGRRLELLPVERAGVLDELEAFVLARVFWVQDDVPMGLPLVQELFQEMFATGQAYSLLNWWRQVLSSDTLARLLRSFQNPMTFFLGILLFVVTPLILTHFRARIRVYLQAGLARARHQPLPSREKFRLSLTGFLGVNLIPFHLAAISAAVHSLALPAAIGTVVEQVFLHFALFTFFWLLNRLLFAPDALGETLFALPEEVAATLNRAIRLVLLAYLVCLLPWMLFHVAPFHFQAIPRLGYTLFEVTASVAVYLLIRSDSALVRHTFGEADAFPHDEADLERGMKGFFADHWTFISRLITLYMATVVFLDISGFRFGAAHLAANGLLTIATIFVMFGLYHGLLAMVDRFLQSRRRMPTVVAPGRRATESRSQITEQIKKTVGMIYILSGFLLLANYWGINESAIQTLEKVTLYNTTGADGRVEMVTLADLFRFVLSLVVMGWLWRQLPRLYELLLFHRLRMDAGLRYAILTISRYLVFLVGLFIALSFLRFDLAQLGWLVAAISVGIGFGLQEIVANFVSGIILLLERPIRVGDQISVAALTGRVTSINIRATTILNPENQEIIVPNRDLITKEVTNWTLASSVVKVLLRIGVSYQSDVDEVRDTLLAVAVAQSEVLREPGPEVLFMEHGESALIFELRVLVPDPSLRLTVLNKLNTGINKAFRERGIDIPFPQRELWVRNGQVAGVAAAGLD